MQLRQKLRHDVVRSAALGVDTRFTDASYGVVLGIQSALYAAVGRITILYTFIVHWPNSNSGQCSPAACMELRPFVDAI